MAIFLPKGSVRLELGMHLSQGWFGHLLNSEPGLKPAKETA